MLTCFFVCDPQRRVVENAFATVALVAEGSVTCGFDLSAVPLLYVAQGTWAAQTHMSTFHSKRDNDSVKRTRWVLKK